MDRASSQDWLELYRPDRPDPDLPELESLRKRVGQSPQLQQRLAGVLAADARIGAALRDVEVPADLKAKVLARLAAADVDVAEPQPEPSTLPVKLSHPIRRRFHRRFAVAALGTALAASVLLAVVMFPNTKSMSFEAICSEAIDVYNSMPEMSRDASEWDEATNWPVGFDWGLCSGARREQFLGESVYAYQFVRQNRRWAVLLMVPRDSFPASIDLASRYADSTQGLTVQLVPMGDYVCVAVFQGKDGDLDQFRDSKSFT